MDLAQARVSRGSCAGLLYGDKRPLVRIKRLDLRRLKGWKRTVLRLHEKGVADADIVRSDVEQTDIIARALLTEDLLTRLEREAKSVQSVAAVERQKKCSKSLGRLSELLLLLQVAGIAGSKRLAQRKLLRIIAGDGLVRLPLLD